MAMTLARLLEEEERDLAEMEAFLTDHQCMLSSVETAMTPQEREELAEDVVSAREFVVRVEAIVAEKRETVQKLREEAAGMRPPVRLLVGAFVAFCFAVRAVLIAFFRVLRAVRGHFF